MPIKLIGTVASNNQAGRGSYWIARSTTTASTGNGLKFSQDASTLYLGTTFNSDGTVTGLISLNASNYVTNWQSAYQYYDAQVNHINDLDTDSNNNIYACADAGSSRDAFIAKYNSSGISQWHRKLAGFGNDKLSAIVYGEGNVYSLGSIDISVPVQGRSFVVSYSDSGTLNWQKVINDSANTLFFEMSAIAYSSTSTNKIAIGGGGYLNSASARTPLIGTMSTTGTVAWFKRGTGNSGTITGVSFDTTGNVYVSGQAFIGSWKSFVAKFDNSGTLIWQRSISCSQNSTIVGNSCIDKDGNIYLITYTGSNGLLIAKWNSSGTIQWQRQLTSGVQAVSGFAIVHDGKDAISIGFSESVSGAISPMIAKFKDAGSGTGTYSLSSRSYTYSASSFTEEAYTDTWTSETVTTSNTTATASMPSVTTMSNTLSFNYVKVP